MELSKMLSMCAIAKRFGGVGRATLVGIKECYSLGLPIERTFEDVSKPDSNYCRVPNPNSGHYRFNVSV